jgi:two-component system, LuxR family, response regulator FixJ
MATGAPLVTVVEDDRGLREQLGRLLVRAGMRCSLLERAEDLIDLVDRTEPDAVLLDLFLPGMDGLECLGRLARLKPGIPVIVLTGQADVPLAVSAMERGALTLLEKPVSEERLLAALRSAFQVGESRRAQEAERLRALALLTRLSPRERQVVDLVVRGEPNKNIARDLGLSPKTVEVHRANAMRKLNVQSLPELVRMVLTTERTQASEGPAATTRPS